MWMLHPINSSVVIRGQWLFLLGQMHIISFLMSNNSKSVLNFSLASVPAELPAGQNVLDTNAISL